MNLRTTGQGVEVAVSKPEAHPKGKRTRRILIGLLSVAVLSYAGIGWYVSGVIIDGIASTHPPVEYDTDVLAVSSSEIRLDVSGAEDAEADRDAVMGIRWDGGFGRVEPAAAIDGAIETRPFELLSGELPPVGDDVVDFSSFVYPDDPSTIGIDFETVTYPSELGELEAWYIPGRGSTWLIGVHGINSERAEFNRLLTAIADLEYPTLLVSYRNDPGAPTTDEAFMLIGQEEWRDLEAAVDFSLANGAEDVILVGPSMGGAISLSYVLETGGDAVRGVVLDAPLADFRQLVDIRSGEALPIGGPIGDSLLAAGRLMAWLRIGIDFDTVDYVDRAGGLDVPVLLFHGQADDRVPFAVGQALAEARPDVIEFHPVPDAAHVRAWNEDPVEYGRIVKDFLNRIGRS